VTLRHGSDITIISSGLLVGESLKAADLLAQQGIHARVIDMFTWKPLDRDLIINCAKETGAIVLAENHQLASGLGHSVAAVVAETCPVPMGFIGAKDCFGEVGDLPYLLKTFEMRDVDIVAKVMETIKRKL